MTIFPFMILGVLMIAGLILFGGLMLWFGTSQTAQNYMMKRSQQIKKRLASKTLAADERKRAKGRGFEVVEPDRSA